MGSIWAASLGHQYETAIDALARALRDCPDELWEESLWTVQRTDPWMAEASDDGGRTDSAIQVFSAFWYVAYHCVFYLDLYLSGGEEGFTSPAPFGGPAEHGLDPDGRATRPFRVYTRTELLDYAAHCGRRARTTLEAVTDEQAGWPCPPGSPHAGKPFAQLLLVNLSHVAEHSAQLALFLGQKGIPPTAG